MSNNISAARPREVWIDWLRVTACLMVMIVHSTEPFFIGGDGALVLTRSDALWTALFDCGARCCVPLFLVASSYLQFPLHYSSGEFFRRRAARILVPFVLWSVFFAFWWGEPVDNLRSLLWNFNAAAGHLWFVYMLIGLYLVMPLLSPWAERVSRRELQAYLCIWLFTTLIPILRHLLSGDTMAIIYGPSGVANIAHYPLWGETYWNSNGTFYYVSGMVGYLLIGLYFRRFVGHFSWRKTLTVAVPSFLTGLAICFWGFARRLFSQGTFPATGDMATVVDWDSNMSYDTLGIALMAIALILVFRKVSASGGFYERILLPISKTSYGMYLLHIALLTPISAWVRSSLGLGTDGILGIWTTPVEIILTAALSFLAAAVVAILLQHIPKVGKYLVG